MGRGAGPAWGTVSLAQPVGWVLADLASSYQPHHLLSCLTKDSASLSKLGYALHLTLTFSLSKTRSMDSALSVPDSRKDSVVHSSCPPLLHLLICIYLFKNN